MAGWRWWWVLSQSTSESMMAVCGGGRAAATTAAHRLTRQGTAADAAGQRPSRYSGSDMLALSKRPAWPLTTAVITLLKEMNEAVGLSLRSFIT